MVFRLWNFIVGYVIITVKGYFIEKFINISSKRNIKLWNLKRDDKGNLIASLSRSDFHKLRPVALKSRCRVRIISKHGLPFFIRKYRKRKGFLVGMVLCFTIVIFMSQIVWSVEIQGDPTISFTEVNDFLRSIGVYPGVMKSRINIDYIQESILDEMADIGWAGVDLEGTKLYINLSKRDPLPEVVPMNAPSDVVAKKAGIIKQVISKRGIDMVKPGDAVVEGQVLISGTFMAKHDEGREVHVHATGEVIAQTWYEDIRKIEMQEVQRFRTGNMYTHTNLSIFGINLGFKPRKVQYSLYETFTEDKTIFIGDKLRLPINIKKYIYYENDVKILDIDFEEAREIAIDEAYKACLEKIPNDATVVNKQIENVPLDNGALAVRVVLECEEDIGMEVALE